MSKNTSRFVRSLQAATLIALVSATPAFAKAPAKPVTFAVKVDTPSTVLANAASTYRPQGEIAMNVVLTCVRSGPRMVC